MLRRWAQAAINRLPVAFRDAYQSATGVRLRLDALGSEFRRRLAWLKESQWWEADRIREFQDARVRELAAHAYDTVPFYRRWFDAAGVGPEDIRTQDDLRRLPILTKQHVREHQREMVSLAYRSRAWARRGTSGTTGTAVVVVRARDMQPLQRAIFWRHRDQFGVPPLSSIHQFSVRTGIDPERSRPPFWWHDYPSRVTYVSLAHLTPRCLPAIAQWFARRRLAMLCGWPNAMVLLADFLAENRVALRQPPRLVSCGAETLLPQVERRLADGFCAPVTSMYGQVEFAGHMVRCPHGRYHLDSECCCIETLPVPRAEPGVVSLVFTGWGNPAMPFIRYDVGDTGVPAEGPCPCGRQSASFLSIDGRMEAYVRTPDGRTVFGLNVHLPSAREVQVYQDRLESIEVRVVPGPDYDPGQEAEMVRRLRTLVGQELRIDIVRVEHIPRSPSGKFRAVVSELADQSPEQRELAAAARR